MKQTFNFNSIDLSQYSEYHINMNKWRWPTVCTLACLLALMSYRAVDGFMTAGPHRILIGEFLTMGNSAVKTGGAYSLLGNTSQLGAGPPGYVRSGVGTLTGGSYTLNWGTVNSWRPAQADVSKSHAYPNPCNLGRGCNNVTFTRLTMDATVRVYTISGELVATIKKSSSIDSIGWDLRNSSGRQIASGLYLYISDGNGTVKRGKLVVVR